MNLTPYWDYILSVSQQRLANNKTKRHVSEYGEEIEVMGAAGELAAHIFLGVPLTLHTTFDGGTDLDIGLRIDVKATHLTTQMWHRNLQWRVEKPIRAEIILMAGVNLGTQDAAILGYATQAEVRTAPVNRTRRFACHEIPIANLHNPWELVAVLSSQRAGHSFSGSPALSQAYGRYD